MADILEIPSERIKLMGCASSALVVQFGESPNPAKP